MSLLDKFLIAGAIIFWVGYFYWYLKGIGMMDELKKKGFRFPQHSDLDD